MQWRQNVWWHGRYFGFRSESLYEFVQMQQVEKSWLCSSNWVKLLPAMAQIVSNQPVYKYHVKKPEQNFSLWHLIKIFD